MTVYFVGAGPGAVDLITVRGWRLISGCDVCVYAGSLVPEELIACVPKHARVIDSAPLVLDELMEIMESSDAAGLDVVRVHSGDPSLYGAMGEQMRRLDEKGISYEVVPGVPAFAATAAALKRELTLPGIAQTVILTRTAMKASNLPEGEDLGRLGSSGATLVIHLSVRNMSFVCRRLIPHYGEDCPVAVAYRVSWPDQKIIQGCLGDIRDKVRMAKITRTALIIVGPVLRASAFGDSALYSADHRHIFRVSRGQGKLGE